MLNDKIKEEDLDWINSTFSWTFYYAPPPLLNIKEFMSRELLLYHEYDSEWYLAEKKDVKGIMGTTLGLITFSLLSLSFSYLTSDIYPPSIII